MLKDKGYKIIKYGVENMRSIWGSYQHMVDKTLIF